MPMKDREYKKASGQYRRRKDEETIRICFNTGRLKEDDWLDGEDGAEKKAAYQTPEP